MKNKININNYEEFAIDYIEGNLDEATKMEFEYFLEQNPSIKHELEGISDVYVEPSNEVYSNKQNLKHSEIEGISQFDYLCIAGIEGVISKQEKEELKFIFDQNNDFLKDYELYSKTKIKQDEVLYPNPKHELKESGIEHIPYLEYLMISKTEGTITTEQEEELTKISSNNPAVAKEMLIMSRTKLRPDNNIVFPNKKSLKRTQIVTIRNISTAVASIAAIFLIFIGIKAAFGDKTSDSAMICKNNSEYNFSRSLNESNNQNTHIEHQNDDYIYDYQQQNEYLYAIEDQNNEDTANLNNDYEQYDEYILAEEEIESKEINLQLTKLKDHYRRFSSIPKPNEYYYSDNKVLAAQDDKTAGQKILDFVVTQYNNFTENDLELNVDIDKENKCYGIEINDKDYNICLDDIKLLKKISE